MIWRWGKKTIQWSECLSECAKMSSVCIVFVGWIMIWKPFKHGDLALFVKVVENIYKRWSDDYWTWSYSNFNKKNSVNFEPGWIKPTGLKWSSFMHPWGRTSHSSTAFFKLMRPSHPSKKTISWESNFESLAKLFGQYVFLGKVINPIFLPIFFNHPNQKSK